MEARSLSGHFIHKGIDLDQAYALLFDTIDAVGRRGSRLIHTSRLFGPHPVLQDKIKAHAELVRDIRRYMVWLVRESSVDGFLAIDALKFNLETDEWSQKSHRIALTNFGWVFLAPEDMPEMLPGFIYVNRELKSARVELLLRFLEKHQFRIDMMLAPEEPEKIATPKKSS